MTESIDPGADAHKLAAPLMEAIGHVAQHWARLEHEINKQIWAMSALEPEDGACITAQITSIVPRLRALISLAHRNGASENLLSDLNKFSAKADGLGRRRNRVIHDPWFYRESQEADISQIEYGRLEVSADRRLTYEIKPQTRKDVLNIAHDIIAVTEEFRALRSRIADELQAQIESRLGKPQGDAQDQIGPDSGK